MKLESEMYPMLIEFDTDIDKGKMYVYGVLPADLDDTERFATSLKAMGINYVSFNVYYAGELVATTEY